MLGLGDKIRNHNILVQISYYQYCNNTVRMTIGTLTMISCHEMSFARNNIISFLLPYKHI